MQCRPELAPGFSPTDASQTLARLAAKLLEENCGSIESLEQVAEHLGCTDRHLRRIFNEEYHVSPVEYLQTCRLLLAKNLLTDTNLSITNVAMASGFGSLRRFNDLFKKQYRLAPTALRRQKSKTSEQIGQDVTLTLSYRPPYEWDKLLFFLSVRAVPGSELVSGGAYYRTVRLASKGKKEVYGWIKVENVAEENALNVTVSASLLQVLPKVLSRVKHLFDLNCDPNVIYERLRFMDEVKPGICVLGTRLPGCFDPFEMAVRAVLGQQITVKAASTLAGRLNQAYGTPVQTGVPGLTHLFVTAQELSDVGSTIVDKLRTLGIVFTRANTIFTLAQALAEGAIVLDTGADPQKTMQQLMELPGIGAWTAGYIVMRTLGWTDVFLETDHGIQKVMAPRSRREILDLAESWRPWRSYATVNLWNSI